MKIGIVGLPNVGKSTLFKLLTKQDIVVANYPFATIDPNIGIVQVPDERLEKLSVMSKSAKTIPAVVEFYDIAGLVKGANKGEGLGNQFLSHIREVQAIVHVVRCFSLSDILHVEQSVNPLRDIETIHTELILKDLETVQKRLDKLEHEARSGDKGAIKAQDCVKRVEHVLNENRLAYSLGQELLDEQAVKELFLLTAKPQLYLLNGKPEDVSEELKQRISELGSEYLVYDLAGLQHLDELIQKAYRILNLISFLTTGEKESRAWTIAEGTKAPQAAGVIHTDFEKKFIRAEVIQWDKLLEAGSFAGARQKGWLRLEGKGYEVQDGDVVEFRV